MRYTARGAGPVEEVYACRVFGMASPLGFVIKGKNRVCVGLVRIIQFTENVREGRKRQERL